MIVIIDYGVGNLRSVQKAFAYLGYETLITSNAGKILAASHVVLPGVGAFGDAMASLEKSGLINCIEKIVKEGKPFLGICLGMQLLFDQSSEGGVVAGLSLLPGEVKKLSSGKGLKIPHMGWNRLEYKHNPLFEGLSNPCYVYFVHSYYVEPMIAEHIIGTTSYGREIPVAVNKDNIFGLQFHPEKSGREGLTMLKNFARMK